MASLDFFPKALRMAQVLGAAAYSLARLYFMAEAIRTLFYLPQVRSQRLGQLVYPIWVEDDSVRPVLSSNISKSYFVTTSRAMFPMTL